MAQKIDHAWRHQARTTLSHYGHRIASKERQFNFPHYLPLYFDQMIGDKQAVTIADLGSGPFCIIGNLWTTAKVSVIASDILADEFNVLFKERGIIPVIPVERQDMEALTYPDCSMDIVHAVNALDHVTDIIKALDEMWRVCKPGGWIYLRHYPHVGLHQNYCGMHHWNLDYATGIDCRIWNKEHEYFLSQVLPGCITSRGREYGYEPRDMIISIYHKQHGNYENDHH